MANYIWHKVVCTKDDLDAYFIDNDPFDGNPSIGESYISFNRLFGVKSLDEYREKVDYNTISYGHGFSWSKCENGLYEIKFCTRWNYPILAIIKAIELCHDLVWYSFDEAYEGVSRFFWDKTENKVTEYGFDPGFAFDVWEQENEYLWNVTQSPDDPMWLYLKNATVDWHPRREDNLITKYLKT